jgi:IS1 family transposase
VHLDEMAVMFAGRQFWLWRAVDDEGEVLDMLVQRRRDKTAAVKLLRKLLKKQGSAPDVLVTDKLRSYGAVRQKLDCRLTTSGACARTIGLRIGISRHGGASARCSVSSPPGSALLVHSRRRPQHLQRSAPSHIPPHAPSPPGRSVPDVAGGHRGLSSNRGF